MLMNSFNIFLIIMITFVTYKYFVLREKISPDENRYSQLVAGISSMVDCLEGYDKPHSRQIAALAIQIGQQMNMTQKQLQTMEAAAMLHDVGQMLLPREIFRSREKLAGEKLDLLKTHPLLGELHLKNQFADADEVPSIIRWHHERWDGMGYPDNLKGEEIPRAARIIALADAVSAMSEPRAYRKQALNEKKEIARELVANSGLQFDPEVVAVWLKINQISVVS